MHQPLERVDKRARTTEADAEAGVEVVVDEVVASKENPGSHGRVISREL